VKLFTVNVERSLMIAMALLVPVVSAGFLALSGQGKVPMLSEKDLIRAYQTLQEKSSGPIYYLNYLPQSAIYYSSGSVTKVTGATTHPAGHEFWLAVHKTDGDASSWNCELRFTPNRGIFDLYFCTSTGKSS
jgi:hypothetical protein